MRLQAAQTSRELSTSSGSRNRNISIITSSGKNNSWAPCFRLWLRFLLRNLFSITPRKKLLSWKPNSSCRRISNFIACFYNDAGMGGRTELLWERVLKECERVQRIIFREVVGAPVDFDEKADERGGHDYTKSCALSEE